MNIQQLTYIVEIANRKSISRAAEYLFVSQPALSQQIRNLEKELGYRVFYRTSKGLDAYVAIKDGSLDMALDRMPENEIGMEKCVCFAKELIREKQCILTASDHSIKKEGAGNTGFSEVSDYSGFQCLSRLNPRP